MTCMTLSQVGHVLVSTLKIQLGQIVGLHKRECKTGWLVNITHDEMTGFRRDTGHQETTNGPVSPHTHSLRPHV